MEFSALHQFIQVLESITITLVQKEIIAEENTSAQEMGGTTRKEGNAMPVEIAIQRELAYRRKVSAFHLRPNISSSKKTLPLQVKSTSLASKPMALPGPNSRQLSPCFTGTKRKEPTSSSHHPPQKHHQPFHGNLIRHKAKADNIHCKICQVPCSSPSNLEQHLRGHKHREKLLELEFGEKGGRECRSNQRQWCEACKVSCMNEDLLKLHFQGMKHKAQLLKLETKRQGGEDPNKKKWCELCRLWCIDEFAFKQHLEGRKHIIQLHAMKEEKRQP